ncbi:MAG: reprolysin-like metallopeptidase, partial [Flavobacteriales bacterium]
MGVAGNLTENILQELNIASNESDATKKEAVLSWINVILQNTNSIFQRDVGIQFELIDQNEEIVFLDPATDNLSSLDQSDVLSSFPGILESTISSSTYDFSHLLRLGGGGIAHLFGVCEEKTSSGITGIRYNLDPYLGTFAHEIGHQFSARHTFNNCEGLNEQLTQNSAVETGSGNTLMSYNGLCESTDVPGGEYLYFHSQSIQQMKAYVADLNCQVRQDNDNTIPVINAGKNHIIPANTPFLLEGEVNDPDGDALSFTWSQMDAGQAVAPPVAQSKIGALFRWLPPSSAPSRYFPNLETIKRGELANTWEVLPAVSRYMNFDFRVRDNVPFIGTTVSEKIKVEVKETLAPFSILTQNEAEQWFAGTKQLIQWEVGQTDSSPINTPKVDVYFSTDDGEGFTLLVEGIPNTGSYELTVPFGLMTSSGRIMLKGHENIFLDINDAPISVVETDFYAALEKISQSQCLEEDNVFEFKFLYKSRNGFNETVRFSIEDDTGIQATFDLPTVTSDATTVVLQLSDFTTHHLRETKLNLTLSAGATSYDQPLYLFLTDQLPAVPLLESPKNEATSLRFPYQFQWEETVNATYTLEISTAANFETIVVQEQLENTHYTSTELGYDTNYFWRVRAENTCGRGSFSPVYSFTTQSENEFRTFVPDDAFEQALIDFGLDDTLDDYVDPDNIGSVQELNLRGLGIASIEGIEGFIQLEELTLWENKIDSI